MASLRARFAALLLAIGVITLGGQVAFARDYQQALAGFAAGSFNDTDAAIGGVATSGHPLAAKVIRALQDRRLLFDPDDRRIYIREPSGAYLDAATGRQARGFRQFLLRGVEAVRAEWALICTAHNLTKLAQGRGLPAAVRRAGKSPVAA